jgi:hypothetical protein
MWKILVLLIILSLVCLITVREGMKQDKPGEDDAILVYPEEIINSNYIVYTNRAPTGLDSKYQDNYVLARPLPTPTTRRYDHESLMRDCVIRGYRCSLILENERKELYGYNQYSPIMLEYRQGYNTYVGYTPEKIRVPFISADSDIVDYKVIKDFAPQYAVLGTNGFKGRSIEHVKSFCRDDNESNDNPCANFVHNKKSGFIMTNQPGDILYSSPGYDTYIAIGKL